MPMPITHKISRTGLVLAAASGLALATLGGCDLFNTQKPGGRLASLDQHTYISDTYTPKTVRLMDTRTLEEIWSMDVPVGQKLVIRFYPRKSKGNIQNPDIMRWEMFPATQIAALLDNEMPVPGREARRIEWELRRGPEYAPDTPPVVTDIMPGGGPVAPAPIEVKPPEEHG